ncbi:MAG: PTS sugar transporter subunit IIA [Myxococcales bacterium]|nr:PTS sugar transporter subunit IIA [Myxococcales bacterium]
MRLSEMLDRGRIFVDVSGSVSDKKSALHRLAEYIAPVVGADNEALEEALAERERLQSTGIGDGVAIPHTSVESAPGQAAALILCPRGVPFDSIDGGDVSIIFGVVGPKRAAGEHLRALARISRLLRDSEVRRRLITADDSDAVFQLISEHDIDPR